MPSDDDDMCTMSSKRNKYDSRLIYQQIISTRSTVTQVCAECHLLSVAFGRLAHGVVSHDRQEAPARCRLAEVWPTNIFLSVADKVI